MRTTTYSLLILSAALSSALAAAATPEPSPLAALSREDGLAAARCAAFEAKLKPLLDQKKTAEVLDLLPSYPAQDLPLASRRDRERLATASLEEPEPYLDAVLAPRFGACASMAYFGAARYLGEEFDAKRLAPADAHRAAEVLVANAQAVLASPTLMDLFVTQAIVEKLTDRKLAHFEDPHPWEAFRADTFALKKKIAAIEKSIPSDALAHAQQASDFTPEARRALVRSRAEEARVARELSERAIPLLKQLKLK